MNNIIILRESIFFNDLTKKEKKNHKLIHLIDFDLLG